MRGGRRPLGRLFEAIGSSRRPSFAVGWQTQLAVAAALILSLSLWLVALGRPLLCPCGTVTFWVSDVRSPQASQQFADWYSLLHVVFGLGLWLFLDWMKPRWSTGQKLLIAIASSVIWEAVENLPVVIELFGNAEGAPPYEGDTILNALADTLFVTGGFFLARSLPPLVTLALAIMLEALVLRMAGDGYMLGILRLVGVPI